MSESHGSDEIEDTPSERAEDPQHPGEGEKASEAPGTTEEEREELHPGAAG